MLRLYWADVSALSPDGSRYDLSDYRRKKLLRLRPDSARRQGIGAELLLRAALRDCAPGIPWPPRITAGKYGRPEWDVKGLIFNLSHSGPLAACAIADRPLGLDVQAEGECRSALAERFFAPDERAFLAASPDPDADFGMLWSLKESWIKALGTGLATPLASFSVLEGSPLHPEAAFWHMQREGVHFALCVPGGVCAKPDRIIEKQLP